MGWRSAFTFAFVNRRRYTFAYGCANPSPVHESKSQTSTWVVLLSIFSSCSREQTSRLEMQELKAVDPMGDFEDFDEEEEEDLKWSWVSWFCLR